MATGLKAARHVDIAASRSAGLDIETARCRPLDPCRVLSSSRSIQPTATLASEVISTAREGTLSSGRLQTQDLLHTKFLQQASPQKHSIGRRHHPYSFRRLGGTASVDADAKGSDQCSMQGSSTLPEMSTLAKTGVQLDPTARGLPPNSHGSRRPDWIQNRPNHPSTSDVLSSRAVHKNRSDALSLKMDQETFRNFWPLLDESRDYARMSGCRFRSRSFDGVAGERHTQEVAPESESITERTHSDDRENRLVAARARAAPAVYRFAERLRAGEIGLLEEVDKAFRIVMAESVRSAMIATCQTLELWPPSPTPAGITGDDCAFEDVSAPLPVIAQRLYNDEQRRSHLTPHKSDMDPMKRRGMMASYIVEFALAAGTAIPPVPTTFDMMLSEFREQAMVWEETQKKLDVFPHPTSNESEPVYNGRKGIDILAPASDFAASMWATMKAGGALTSVLGTANADRWKHMSGLQQGKRACI